MSATAADFYRELITGGYSVTVDGDRLLVAPRDWITDQLRQRIRAEKPALLRLLAPPDAQARREVRVYRVLVAMDQGQGPKWTFMLGCTDMADARKSAAGTFGGDRVIRIEAQQ